MRLEVIFDHAAEGHFRLLSLAAQTRIATSLYRYAETGEGDIAWAPPYHVLRADRFDLEITIDREAGTLCVIRLRRAR